MKLEETILGSRTVHEGRTLKLRTDTVRLPDGRESTRDIVEHRGAVAIVPLLSDGSVVLVRQYRLATGGVLTEIPAGTRDAGEDPLACAHRELEEETGFRAGKMEPLGSVYMAPGYSTEMIHLYLATGLTASAPGTDDDEFVEVLHVPLREAVSKALAGEYHDAKTVCGLLVSAQRLGYYRPDEAE